MLIEYSSVCCDIWSAEREYRPPVTTTLISVLLLDTYLGVCEKRSSGSKNYVKKDNLTLILLKWRIGWPPNNASIRQLDLTWLLKGEFQHIRIILLQISENSTLILYFKSLDFYLVSAYTISVFCKVEISGTYKGIIMRGCIKLPFFKYFLISWWRLLTKVETCRNQ